MCRLIVFIGTCTCCGGSCTWEDLSQELSCLEAKNAGAFGECQRGIQKEEHTFDQECDDCAAAAEADEGYGELEDEQEEARDKGKQKAEYLEPLDPPGAKSSSDRRPVDEDGRRSKKQRTS